IEGARVITGMGRENIGKANKYLMEKHGAEIIYNDTDSSAIDMHLTDPADICKWGKRLSKEISGTKDGGGVFEWPLEMAFEKGILDLGLFGKKMYAYL